MLVILTVLISVLVCSVEAFSRPQWRETQSESLGKSLTDPKLTDGVEIFGRSGVIAIRTSRTVQVKVFTILGQLVSQATLQPGTSELRVSSRGIYMVKVGGLTQKVAL